MPQGAWQPRSKTIRSQRAPGSGCRKRFPDRPLGSSSPYRCTNARKLFFSGMTMGVAWGSTTAAVSRNLVPRPLRDSRVVQLNGAGNTLTTGVTYSGEILRRFGEAYGATVEQFPVPAFFDDPSAKETLWRERSTKRIFNIQSSMDVVLIWS
jgi:DNA-binding transcriptional regulator LsrR (DeoR family)